MSKGDSIFVENAKASQLPQYDDITLRNMEVINTYANMQNSLAFGATNQILYTTLKEFHFFFTGLHGATYLETQIKNEDAEKIKTFLANPLIKPLQGNMNSTSNRTALIDSCKAALEVFDIYQAAMKKAGYRKTTYTTLNHSEKWRSIG